MLALLDLLFNISNSTNNHPIILSIPLSSKNCYPIGKQEAVRGKRDAL